MKRVVKESLRSRSRGFSSNHSAGGNEENEAAERLLTFDLQAIASGSKGTHLSKRFGAFWLWGSCGWVRRPRGVHRASVLRPARSHEFSATWNHRGRRPQLQPSSSASSRGSVILIVLITIMFAAVALTLFIEKAGNDLLVDAREADAVRLRAEAFSALETTLGVLEDFRVTAGGLHSPAEGWGNPLEFAHYEPAAGRTVDVQFVDESAKISLPKAQPSTFVELFKGWGIVPADAQKLTDALMVWMKKDAPPGSSGSPRVEDYNRGQIPSVPPGRSLHSFNELASIEYARTVFYDENGEPNELWHRFEDAFSLYSYEKANINGGNPAALTALGVTDPAEKKRLQDFINGTGTFQRKGPGFFKGPTDVAAVFGASSPAAGLSVDIAALRIIVTVHEGRSLFRLSTIIAPQGGATVPPKTADAAPGATVPGKPAATPPKDSGAPAPTAATPKSRVATGGGDAKSLNYPFTILEIRENDDHLTAPPDSAI